jgi:hypothetical protein
LTRWKSHHHKRLVTSCVEARKALAQVVRIVDAHLNDGGEPYSEVELRDKIGIAATWLQKAETELTQARANMTREIEYRELEADPETIRHRQFQQDVKRLEREARGRRRRSRDEVAPDVLRLRTEGMVPAAIADALHISDSMVNRILREEKWSNSRRQSTP